MINKIGNWVFGSFFRTIGRLLVFVLLGFIIANLVDFSDIITNFRITDLFFEKVNAAATDFSSYWQSDMFNASGIRLNYNVFGYMNNCTSGSSSSGAGACTTFFNASASNSGGGISIPDNFDTISFRIQMRNSASMINGYAGGFTFITLNNWGGGSACEIISDSSIQTSESQDLRKIWVIKCPLINGSNAISGLTFYYNGSDLTTYSLEISGDYILSKSSNFKDNQIIQTIESQTNDIISNQNNNAQQQMEQQEQQHNEMMESNTTEAQEEAEGFFGDFSVPDTGGLSGIITAPLNTIRSLLNSTCTNLVLPLPFVNQNLTLPCLYDIYNEHFGAFFSIYQTIILAIVAYRCIRSIYFDIHGFMDPNDDRIEVMDL